ADLLAGYVYSERIETRSERSGRERSRVLDHLFLNGRPVVERNGKYHGEDKSRRQERAIFDDVAHAFRFSLAGESACGDSRCWKVDAEPKPGFLGHSVIAVLLLDLTGAIWARWRRARGSICMNR
ncbi:MAG: hypothetical protein ACRD3Y_08990, partial [Bryobacteraceae bacterium]